MRKKGSESTRKEIRENTKEESRWSTGEESGESIIEKTNGAARLNLEIDVLILMALDRYVAICIPLHYHDIMTSRFLVKASVFCLVKSSSVISSATIVASKINFCSSNIIRHFACENMVLLKLACGDISRTQLLGLMVRVLVTCLIIVLLIISSARIFYTAMKIAAGKARYKTLNTCGTHLLVVVLNYTCGLYADVSYRLSVSVGILNLNSAIYYLLPSTLHPFIYGFRVKIKSYLANSWQR
ncbi:olfactory receptor 52P1-like [Gastrophryne carolinensis]